jgi:NADPH-dependent 2,4-dienoyl-CoA reductase/sulfur reductase-like enzyme
MPEQIVVIGGNAAGMTAASRSKRLKPDLDITILEFSHFISYSTCGLPYYLSNTVKEHEDLITFSPQSLESERGIKARTRVRAEEIQPSRRTIICLDVDSGREFEIGYDQAVISTGYVPKVPDIEGYDLKRVFTVSRLEDGIRIRQEIESRRCRTVAIIGGGYIGLMMAHAMKSTGLEVLLLERDRHVYGQLDEDMAVHVEEELRRQGVELILNTEVKRLKGDNGVFEGIEIKRHIYPADLALIDVGILPNSEWVANSGIPLGAGGAIQVDERGQTRVGGIYAAGNCAETIHRVSGTPIFSALGTSAAKQGRVVGENLAGHKSCFPGTLETSIEKVFDLAVARTGLTLREAFRHGFEAESVKISGHSRAAYYPGSGEMHVKLIFERREGRLLGGQIIGEDSVAKRIDTLVAALSGRMTLQEIAHLDLAYAPPYSTLWDPIQIAANLGLRKVQG